MLYTQERDKANSMGWRSLNANICVTIFFLIVVAMGEKEKGLFWFMVSRDTIHHDGCPGWVLLFDPNLDNSRKWKS